MSIAPLKLIATVALLGRETLLALDTESNSLHAWSAVWEVPLMSRFMGEDSFYLMQRTAPIITRARSCGRHDVGIVGRAMQCKDVRLTEPRSFNDPIELFADLRCQTPQRDMRHQAMKA